MATFSLDEIREAADKKFGHTDIQVGDTNVRLVNALQLPKEKREALSKLQDDEDLEQADLFAAMVRIVARSEHEASVLLDAVGDNVAYLVGIFEAYNKSTELGEA
jgi:predicted HAD superfamily phosphohydrolase